MVSSLVYEYNMIVYTKRRNTNIKSRNRQKLSKIMRAYKVLF
jgi:hypothetical protein